MALPENTGKTPTDFLASTKGEKGDKGDTGADGLSAYDLWVALPENAGKTPADFSTSTKGEKGDKGDKGEKGDTGADGLSAYDLWVALPENTGKTPTDFLASTKGEKGDKGDTGADGLSAYDLWVALPENAGKTPADFSTSTKGEKGDKGDKGDTGADGLSAYDLWAALPENAGKTPADFSTSTKGEKGEKGDTGADGLSAYDLWVALPENAGKTPTDFLASTKGDKGDTGSSTFELWKTLAGNEDKTMDDFITEQKADPKTTKLVDNQNNTFTFYNETEVDNAGAPIAGTGVTFPTRTGYSLTSFINNPTISNISLTYNQLTGINPDPTIATATFDTNENPNDTKFIDLKFRSYIGIRTNNNGYPIRNIRISMHLRVYVNDVLLPYTMYQFKFPANTYYGRYEYIHERYSLKNIPLRPTNNVIKIVLHIFNPGGADPESIIYNTGTATGTFATGNATALNAKIENNSFSLLVYEK